jgi:hydrogenase nickel incorporation protein HypA/HybF
MQAEPLLVCVRSVKMVYFSVWYGSDSMHELSITQNIVDIALKTAENRRVTGITVVLGDLSGVVEESVRFCFGAVAENTRAEGATLSFQRVAAVVRCTGCASEFGLTEGEWECPGCGSVGGHVVQGRECYIDSIEVED